MQLVNCFVCMSLVLKDDFAKMAQKHLEAGQLRLIAVYAARSSLPAASAPTTTSTTATLAKPSVSAGAAAGVARAPIRC